MDRSPATALCMPLWSRPHLAACFFNHRGVHSSHVNSFRWGKEQIGSDTIPWDISCITKIAAPLSSFLECPGNGKNTKINRPFLVIVCLRKGHTESARQRLHEVHDREGVNGGVLTIWSSLAEVLSKEENKRLYLSLVLKFLSPLNAHFRALEMKNYYLSYCRDLTERQIKTPAPSGLYFWEAELEQNP